MGLDLGGSSDEWLEFAMSSVVQMKEPAIQSTVKMTMFVR